MYTFKDFLKERFPFPVRKLQVHTFLGCPHRKDRIGPGGCVYCYNEGFSNVRKDLADVAAQLRSGISKSRRKGFEGRFIAYFQTYTNTYGSIDDLQPMWRTIEEFPDDIVGLAIGTRPDCLSEEILNVLADIGKKVMVWLELGLQSANDSTLELINRGHNYKCFMDAVERIKGFANLLICAHIILGLPGETCDDMVHTLDELNKLAVHGVKIHHLQVVQNTVLADWYQQGRVKVFNEAQYIDLLVKLLPCISPDMVIHRLVGDIREDLLIAPKWKLPKTRIIQLVEKKLRAEKQFQGSQYYKRS